MGKDAERRSAGRGKRLLAQANESRISGWRDAGRAVSPRPPQTGRAEVRDQRSEVSGQRRKNDSLFTLHSSLFVIHFPFPSSFLPDCASPLVVLFLPRSWKVRGSPLSVCCMLSKSLSIRTLGSFRKSFSAYFTGTESFYDGPKVGWVVASGRVNNE